MTDEPKAPIVRIADMFSIRDALPTRVAAPLRRGAPEQWSLHLAELLPILLRANVSEASMRDDDIVRRWAALVHLVAVLSGTTNDRAHADRRRTGEVLHQAGYSEARLSKLLTARGDALRDQLGRLARFLRAKGAMPLDLRPLAELVLNEGLTETRAETARLTIARSYYGAADRAAREETE